MAHAQELTPEALAGLRERYRRERERRVRPDGTRQYLGADAEFGFYAADPWAGESDVRIGRAHV